MVKEMRIDLNPSSLHKRHHVFLKFAVSFVLLGLAFRLFVSDSIRFSSSVVETPPIVETNTITESPPLSSSSASSSSLPVQVPSSDDLLANESQTFPNGEILSSIFCLSFNENCKSK